MGESGRPKSRQALTHTSRASSSPLSTSSSSPASARAAANSSAPFSASRAALVVTLAMPSAPRARASLA